MKHLKKFKLFESNSKIYNADELYFCVTKVDDILAAIIVPKDFWNTNGYLDDSIGGNNVNNDDLENGGLYATELADGIFEALKKIGKKGLKQKMISAGFEYNSDLCENESDEDDDDENDGSEQEDHITKLFKTIGSIGDKPQIELDNKLKDMTLEEQEQFLEKTFKDLLDQYNKNKKNGPSFSMGGGVGVIDFEKQYIEYVEKKYKEVRKRLIEIDDEINDANDDDSGSDLYWRMGGR